MPARITRQIRTFTLTLLLGASSGCPAESDGDSASETSSESTPTGDSTTTANSSSEPQPTTTTESSSGEPQPTTAGEEGACACIPEDDFTGPNAGDPDCDGGPCPLPPTCGEELCPIVEVDPAGMNCFVANGKLLVDPAAVDCALTALRDRTPGFIRWICHPAGDGQFTRDGFILIVDDETAVRREWGHLNGLFQAGPALLGDLPAPDVFTTCLGLGTASDRYNCLTGTNLTTTSEMCVESWGS